MRTMDLLLPSLAVCLLFTILREGGSCRNKETPVGKAPAEKTDRLAKGVWGGEHIRLEVTDTGAEIEYDCASGTINEPVILDRDGNFNVKGKYTPQHAGPIGRDEESNSSNVRYEGQAKDSEMTLTLTIPDKKETIGSFTLTRGSEGRVMKCR